MSGTRISKDVTIEGDLSCSGPLEVWGRIDGDVVAAKLEIMTGGRVTGTVEADELVVRGEHVGSAICSAVSVAAGAIVNATITSKTLACEAGATISGTFLVNGDVACGAQRSPSTRAPTDAGSFQPSAVPGCCWAAERCSSIRA